MKFNKFDLIIIGVSLAIAVLSFIPSFTQKNYDRKIANIIVDGKTALKIDLQDSKNQEIDLDLKENNIIMVKKGTIGIVDASCKDKFCKNTGFISRPGQSIVCVPSRLIIEIEGVNNKYDAVLGGVQ